MVGTLRGSFFMQRGFVSARPRKGEDVSPFLRASGTAGSDVPPARHSLSARSQPLRSTSKNKNRSPHGGLFCLHRGFFLNFAKHILIRSDVVLCKILRSPFGKQSTGLFSSLLRIPYAPHQKTKTGHHMATCFCLVEHRGFEPLTPTLPVLCAPNCANAPFLWYFSR